MAKVKAKAKPRARTKPTKKPTRSKSAIVFKPSGAPKELVELQLSRVRELCTSLPDVTEKISHGFPTYFVKKKCFAYFLDNHHNDGRLALWCMAPPGAQAMLVDSDSDYYFVPPYVGHQGWVGVRLDKDNEWSQIAAVLENAYETRAAKK
jgi:hypothetical protein